MSPITPAPVLADWSAAQCTLVLLLLGFVALAMARLARREFERGAARKVAYAVVLTAIAAMLGSFSIPVGTARLAPSQHMVNVMAAVMLGPWWATLIAFTAAVIRNAAATGSPLAFPGGMIGAFLAGLAWRATQAGARDAAGGDRDASSGLSRRERIGLVAAGAGEVVGTGLIAATLSGLIVAPVIMGRNTTAFVFIVPFLASSLVGTTIGLIALYALRRAELVQFDRGR